MSLTWKKDKKQVQMPQNKEREHTAECEERKL